MHYLTVFLCCDLPPDELRGSSQPRLKLAVKVVIDRLGRRPHRVPTNLFYSKRTTHPISNAAAIVDRIWHMARDCSSKISHSKSNPEHFKSSEPSQNAKIALQISNEYFQFQKLPNAALR
uniref:Uncharacterized protein n=1 Tax=Glossina pallidipes TaxID=7398 RepID=A0A1A9ZMZ6_GLOPL